MIFYNYDGSVIEMMSLQAYSDYLECLSFNALCKIFRYLYTTCYDYDFLADLSIRQLREKILEYYTYGKEELFFTCLD